jgi:hypothetical protein
MSEVLKIAQITTSGGRAIQAYFSTRPAIFKHNLISMRLTVDFQNGRTEDLASGVDGANCIGSGIVESDLLQQHRTSRTVPGEDDGIGCLKFLVGLVPAREIVIQLNMQSDSLQGACFTAQLLHFDDALTDSTLKAN